MKQGTSGSSADKDDILGSSEAELKILRPLVLFFCLLSLTAAQISDVEAARGDRDHRRGDPKAQQYQKSRDRDSARRNRGPRRGEPKAQQSLISRDRAAAIARSATGGRVLNVQMTRGGRPQYRVKVLVEGKRVRSVGVDARSGAILR